MANFLLKSNAMRLRLLSLALLVGCQEQQGLMGAPVLGVRKQALDGGAEDVDAGQAPPLSASRKLRRIQLALLGRPPTLDELDALDATPSPEAREAFLAQTIEEDLASVDFYRQTISFAHDWFGVSAHNQWANLSHGYFTGHLSIELHECPAGTLHAGKMGLLASSPARGDPYSICEDSAAPVHQVEPWWAPGSTVPIIGRAGSATPQQAIRQNGQYDCGLAWVSDRANDPLDDPANPACGCGPNLVYCSPTKNGRNANTHTFSLYSPEASRRQASEEAARLFAHLVWHDRSFSDFVVGNYTVAPIALKHMYIRSGRFNASNAFLDDVRWFDPVTTPADPEHPAESPLAWHEVVVEQLNPHLLSLIGPQVATGAMALTRSYQFDPRVQAGQPLGIPAAGGLTTLVGLAAFSRERVRAARWLEALTCRSFVPPPPNLQFNDYHRDPATEGGCQHCHAIIDPAAIFFKRWGYGRGGQVALGGIGPWRWSVQPANSFKSEPFRRWADAYEDSTVLTPASAAQIQQNPDARFIDFLPPDRQLFGATSDGTIGPLGFGKLLVQSGELDRCAVQRLYGRYSGAQLDPAVDDALITELVRVFVDQERKVKPFIRYLLSRPEDCEPGVHQLVHVARRRVRGQYRFGLVPPPGRWGGNRA